MRNYLVSIRLLCEPIRVTLPAWICNSSLARAIAATTATLSHHQEAFVSFDPLVITAKTKTFKYEPLDFLKSKNITVFPCFLNDPVELSSIFLYQFFKIISITACIFIGFCKIFSKTACILILFKKSYENMHLYWFFQKIQ